MIAWAKLEGGWTRRSRFPGQQVVQRLLFLAATLVLGACVVVITLAPAATIVVAFFVAALLFGVLMTLPIGGADMPVVISLYNAFTGLAVGFEGYVLRNRR